MRIKAMLIAGALAGVTVLGVLPACGARATALSRGSTAAAAATAAAVASTPRITRFREMVPDVAQGRLFFSGGTQGDDASNSIIVTNLAGKVVATIGGQDGVEGIALSADSSTLYAALSADGAVSAINTRSLEETALYPLGSGDRPYDVAVQRGRVWVSYSSSTGNFVGAVNPNDIPASAFTPLGLPSSFTTPPQLVADPDGSGALLASEPGTDLATVASYDVATSPVTMYNPPTLLGCELPDDLAIAPGGAKFIVSCGASQQVYNTKTFAETGRYAFGSGQDAVAIAPNGTTAFGAGSAPNVTVYRQGAKTPVNKFSRTGYPVGLAPSGLAFAADSATLFAVYRYPVLKNGRVSSHVFRVFAYRDPGRTASTITLRGTAKAIFRRGVSLTGTLALSVGTPPAQGKITITRTQAGSHVVKRWIRTITVRDAFSLTDTPPSPGTYTYTASYAGTATLAPTTATRQVVITRIPTPLKVSVSAGTVNYRAAVVVTANLGKALAGQIVSVYAQSFGSKSGHLVRIGLAGSSGQLSVRYMPSYSTTFTVDFSGDADYQPVTTKVTVDVRAGVAQSLSGYAASTYIGKVLYRVYQQTDTLLAGSTVTPNKSGACVAFEVEAYVQRTWLPDTISSCVKLNKSSRASAKFTLSAMPDGQFRIRVNFHRTAKDTTNVNADSPWSYFLVIT